ncbi:MAG: succinate dehydrogenase flavoprotein subunit [Deltaproteobacteria bacterium]|nr:succinate dehydrogenase flavoprotein subunit [Deltaproteobacteria bacterium]
MVSATKRPRFVVVGGGLAGLTTVLKLAEAGQEVDLFSVVPVKRSHSVCAQGGINGAVNTKGEGDHPDLHTRDTLRGGDFLAEQPPVKGMCEAAPGIIYLFDRMGVTFNRTDEGLLDFRRFGGTLFNRTAFAGATTGQQLLYALDEQVRRWESEGRVKKYEYWEYLGMVKDGEGACRGIVAADLRTLEVRSFRADAVALCTGGIGAIFGRSTNSTSCTGAAASSAFQEGALYGNPEFIQVHPTAIPGEDKLRLISESVRGEGGRVWVPSDGGKDERTGQPRPPKGEPWYFLEFYYPKYGNLVPRDVGTRELFSVCRQLKLGVGGGDQVYLDVTHIPAKKLSEKLGGVLEIYEKFAGADPRRVPMRIFPAVHYTMGGLWVDYKASLQGSIVAGAPENQATNIPGLFAMGESEYQYHGANRLGANSLLSCVYAGLIGGPAMASYAKNLTTSTAALKDELFEQARLKWKERLEKILKMGGSENPFAIGKQLGEAMTAQCTVVRDNAELDRLEKQVVEWTDRWSKVNVLDEGRSLNQSAMYVNQLWNMLQMARAIVVAARQRDECRGSHYKPDFALPAPKTRNPKDDAEWMASWKANTERWRKTTLARWTSDGPQITYRDIPTPVLEVEPRYYE